MKRVLIAALLFVCVFNAHAQKIKRYTIALTATNPLGAMNKYGGGIEFRFRNVAYMASYYKYISAYPGTTADLDMRIYLRKRWVYMPSNWSYQNYLYVRGIFGSAAFVGPNLKVLGYSNTDKCDDNAYVGGAAGIGRRFSKGAFFVTARAGLRYVALPELEAENKHLYRLFYVTGPGSVLECNFQFGIQI